MVHAFVPWHCPPNLARRRFIVFLFSRRHDRPAKERISRAGSRLCCVAEKNMAYSFV